MDFIERWFGVSPDGGSGASEAFWIVAIIVAVAAFAYRRRIGTWLSVRSRP